MKYLIYMSSARELIPQEELLEILTVSRENNKIKKLTGMLLYGEGTFVQVLEGEESVVNATYDIIEKDSRHKNIIILSKGNINVRNFPDWSMGFRTVNAEVLSQFEGFKDIKTSDLLARKETHPAIILLKTFTATNNLI